MTCNITNTPLYPEPLPLYSRNDPDAVSIHSAAPSYVSETPTYTSRRPSIPAVVSSSLLPPLQESTPREQAYGLPAARFAPGFQSRAHGSVSHVDLHSFNIGSWSSTRTSHASRQYHAVARRRASQAANTAAILNSLSAVPPPLSSSTATLPSPTASSTALNDYPVQITASGSNEPANPLEDPYLVGEVAANRARSQRVYREMCLRGEEAARHESRSWEFMFSQMADWEERGKSWRNFRSRVGQTKLLGRRLGLRA